MMWVLKDEQMSRFKKIVGILFFGVASSRFFRHQKQVEKKNSQLSLTHNLTLYLNPYFEQFSRQVKVEVQAEPI